MTEIDREQQRLQALVDSGLLEMESIPPFEEAVQTVARALDVPIAVVGLLDRDWQWITARSLDAREDLTALATLKRTKRSESFCNHIVETQQLLSIRDTASHSEFAHRFLVGQYGVRAYLGVPLVSAAGHCFGTLAVMDLAPRRFAKREVQFVELAARLAMREVERMYASIETLAETRSPMPMPATPLATSSPLEDILSTNQIKTELLDRLLQELRTPLTSVMGMTSVLNREIYGPLRRKQKEYLKIIHDSGQYLLSLVEEILMLRSLKESSAARSLTSIDMEMLCQQVLKTLEPVARRREQQINESVEAVDRIWTLDKDLVQQILYHAVSRVVHAAETGCTVRVRVARTPEDAMELSVWASHPWLGESLPASELELCGIPVPENVAEPNDGVLDDSTPLPDRILAWEENDRDRQAIEVLPELEKIPLERSREKLGLLFAAQLVRLHGGTMTVRGSPKTGYRYVVTLPNRA
ncbi:GAF domain-containing sensor histidine kinase [Baaleninema simplex]|uniref:GAF domain-containing sensor histidine kinase n=1 Tax=Baaleninema simplex TaxID=2862350 RepID=UPI00036CAC24|nr:GAF domain-containing sensor histidine kinase [Baaleninema simplex]